MFSLTYDLGIYDDETVCEDFDTIEELMERYREIQYDYCEFRAWDEEENEIKPWLWDKFR